LIGPSQIEKNSNFTGAPKWKITWKIESLPFGSLLRCDKNEETLAQRYGIKVSSVIQIILGEDVGNNTKPNTVEPV
jgi:hypothetical protein